MYGWDTLVLLKHYLESGLSKTAIARQLGVSRRVIYHWLTTGQLEREVGEPAPRRRLGPPTKLAPFHALIAERLQTFPALSAIRLFDECRAAAQLAALSRAPTSSAGAGATGSVRHGSRWWLPSSPSLPSWS